MSPSVVGTFIVRNGETTILLWRGKPGWFLGGPRSEGGRSSSDGTIVGSETFGGIRVDYRLATTMIEGQGVPVDRAGGKNVLLIDNIDAEPSQLIVNGVVTMLPPLSGPGTPPGAIFKASPEALLFLRCGEPLQGEQLKLWNRLVCDGPATPP